MNTASKVILSFFICWQSVVAQQVNNSWQLGDKTLPSHPRLYVNDDRIATIKLQKDTISRQLLFILKKDADQKLNAPKIVYPNDVSNMGTSRNVQGRIISLALAYRLFGDEKYLQKAKEELLQLAVVENWGTGHFLDVGEASLAAGIGYDWLYSNLTDKERKTIADAIKNKALLPSLDVKEMADNASWVNGNFNWNPVCHGGLTVAALSIAETEPQLSKQIVERAIKNIPIAGDAYSPDGAFAEGPSYWSYGTSFYVLTIEALRSAFGNSTGLEKIPGFLKTADYNNQMVAPSGEDYNYSDYHIENLNEPVMLWFGRELNRPDVMQDELSDIHTLYEMALTGNEATNTKKIVQNRHTPLEILWLDPALVSKPGNHTDAMVRVSTNHIPDSRIHTGMNYQKSTTPPLHWTANGLMPVAVMRSAWNDPKASFIALKGGTPNNSHGHMDAGSFILEADGVRWALDLGTENYDKMRAAKLDLWDYSQNSSRWTTFRVGPEGHNILRFDGERQLITGKGTIKELPLKNGVMGNIADLSSLYSNKAAKVFRTVSLYPDRSISIKDEWTAKDSAVAVSFQWLTKAQVIKTADGLLLQQDGQTLQVKIEEPALKVAEIEIQDVSASKVMQDSPNPGLSRIVIKTNTVANSTGKIWIRAIPGSSITKQQAKL